MEAWLILVIIGVCAAVYVLWDAIRDRRRKAREAVAPWRYAALHAAQSPLTPEQAARLRQAMQASVRSPEREAALNNAYAQYAGRAQDAALWASMTGPGGQAEMQNVRPYGGYQPASGQEPRHTDMSGIAALEAVRRTPSAGPTPRPHAVRGVVLDYASAGLKIQAAMSALDESLPNRQPARTAAAWALLREGFGEMDAWMTEHLKGGPP